MPKSEVNIDKGLLRNSQESHFKLGSNTEELKTNYNLFYNPNIKQGKPAKLNVEQLEDVKKSHFELGDKKGFEISHYTDQHRWLQPIQKKKELQ